MQSILKRRDFYAAICVLATFVGFVLSRGVYSFGILFMGLYCISKPGIFYKALSDKWVLLSMGIPLLILFKDGPNNIFFVNLAFPLFIAFYKQLAIEKIDQHIHYFLLTAVFFATSCHSLGYYFSDITSAVENYKIAKVLPLGFYDDHVRTSTAIALSIILSIYVYQKNSNNYLRVWLIFYVIFQFIFLHFLSSRIGLSALYFSIFSLSILFIIKSKNLIYLCILALLIVAPILSFIYFPSFYHRIGYTMYDFEYYKKSEYRIGSSDGVRFYSMQAGIDIFQKNKLTGVGFKNLRTESFEWFDKKFPQMLETEKMQPHSQYILYAAAAGIIGLGILLLFLLYPIFFSSFYKSPHAIAIYFTLLLICIIDVFLDHQVKLFVLGFFLPQAVYHLKYD